MLGQRLRFPPDSEFFREGDRERFLQYNAIALPTSFHDMKVEKSNQITVCKISGCNHTCSSSRELDAHVQYCHSHQCSICRKNFSSDHLLSIHISEKHDSYFNLLSKKRPSFVCLVEGCNILSKNCKERTEHLIRDHQYPASFQFDSRLSKHSKQVKGKPQEVVDSAAMEVADQGEHSEAMVVDMEQSMCEAMAATSLRESKVPQSISFGGRGHKGHRGR